MGGWTCWVTSGAEAQELDLDCKSHYTDTHTLSSVSTGPMQSFVPEAGETEQVRAITRIDSKQQTPGDLLCHSPAAHGRGSLLPR